MSVPTFPASQKIISVAVPGKSSQGLTLETPPSQTAGVSKSAMKKKQKKLKDPIAPKKPLTAFFVFLKEERPHLLAELGKMSVGDQGKELGKRWGAMNKQQKEVYEERVKDDWINYREKLKTYQPSNEFLEKKAAMATKPKVLKKSLNNPLKLYFDHLTSSWQALSVARPDMNGKEIQDLVWSNRESSCRNFKPVKNTAKSKKPMSAFQLFADAMLKEARLNNPEIVDEEMIKTLPEYWDNLEEDKKKVFLDQATDCSGLLRTA